LEAERPRRHNFIGTFRPPPTPECGPIFALWTLKKQRPGWIETRADLQFCYGWAGDLPLVGDWDGNGTETQGVYRAGYFFLSNALGNRLGDLNFAYDEPTGILPVVGDWDGDGTTTIGTFLPASPGSAAIFRLRNSNSAGPPDLLLPFAEARPADVPIAGDWLGSGKDLVGVYRPENSTFYLATSNLPGYTLIERQLGLPGDSPVVGDWDGDGVYSYGVKRGTAFYLRNAMVGYTQIPELAVTSELFQAGDSPICGNWETAAPVRPAPFVPGFFVLGVWHQPPPSFADWAKLGINTVVGSPDGTDSGLLAWTEEANRLGLKIIRQPRMDRLADDDREPGLLAWMPFDEPEAFASLERVREVHGKLKSAYPDRRVFSNHSGTWVIDRSCEGADYAWGGPCDGPGDCLGGPSTCYAGGEAGSYFTYDDLVSTDHYPKNQHTPLGTLGSLLDKVRRWAGGKPQLEFIEASDQYIPPERVPGLGGPSAGEMRFEIWDTILHGASGIIYFPNAGYCGPGCQKHDGTRPEIRLEMAEQNARIAELSAILTSEMNPAPYGITVGAATGVGETSPLEAGWRVHGGAVYFLVLNTRNLEYRAYSFAVSGFLPTHGFEVVHEYRSTLTSGQVLTDDFSPYAVHVYRYVLP
jgi:hypothetical protein